MDLTLSLGFPVPRPWDEDTEQRVMLREIELAVRGDRAGFKCLWISEHHFLEEYSHNGASDLQLAAIAAQTRNIRLGTGIVDMQYQINHPLRVAERIGTLDLISNGRVEFGTGRGSGRFEWEPFGVREETTKEVWSEAVHAVLAMWKTERFSWDGEHVKIPGPVNVVPKPKQKPHPPLWMACTNPDTAYEAGRRGIGALMFAYGGLQDIVQRVGLYREGLANPHDRFSDRINDRVQWTVGGLADFDDRKIVLEHMEYQKKFMPLFARYWPHAVGGTLKVDAMADRRRDFTPEDFDLEGLRKAGGLFSGEPKRIVELIHRAAEGGVSEISLAVQPGICPFDKLVRTIEIWGEHILPEFHKDEKASARAG